MSLLSKLAEERADSAATAPNCLGGQQEVEAAAAGRQGHRIGAEQRS